MSARAWLVEAFRVSPYEGVRRVALVIDRGESVDEVREVVGNADRRLQVTRVERLRGIEVEAERLASEALEEVRRA